MKYRTLSITAKIDDFDKYIFNLTLYAKVGKHSFIFPYKDGTVLKVFHSRPQPVWQDPKEVIWGDLPAGVSLWEATIIQNICWLHDLAPRVYGLVKVKCHGQQYWAQIVDDMGNDFVPTHGAAEPVYYKVKTVGTVYGFHNGKDDVSMWDVVGGKLVDFNTFHYNTEAPKSHAQIIVDKYHELARYGKCVYHPVPELGITTSPRKNEDRVRLMGLDKIDFKGKRVLDIGCAGGWFCRYAKDRGAKYVLGIDWPDVKDTNPVLASYLVANELGYWDIDFEDINLMEERVDEQFDIVFYFSMTFHVGVIPWLSEVTKEVCIVEDNSRGRNADPELKAQFSKVEYKAEVRDRGEEEGHGFKVYYCRP
jgi:SAM-dependent methyltransferase